MKFKTMEELEDYMEETIVSDIAEPDRCHMCGDALHDEEGYLSYYTQEDFYDLLFCSEDCIKEFLLSMGYLEEDE
jgi:hypothetical protein